MKAPASGPPVVWDDTLHPMLISRLNRFLGVGSRALLAATILLVSGCAGPSDPLSGSAATLSGRPPVVNLPEATEDSALPPPIVEEGFVRYSHGNPVYPSRDYYDACQAPMQCFSYPFEVKVNATMDARVTWGQDTSIFDLQLFFANSTRAALREGGDKLGERVTNPDTRQIGRAHV